MKMGYQFNDKTSLEFGFASRQQMPEYSMLLNCGKIQFTWDYQKYIEKTSVGVAYTDKGIYNLLTWQNYGNENIVAYIVNFDVVPSAKIHVYLDSGYHVENSEFLLLEGGILKDFDGKLLHGLVGIGYSYEIRAFKLYTYVHL